MSDHLRHSSPGVASPGRSAPIARPTWPWQPSSLHSSSSTSSIGSVDLRQVSVSSDNTPPARASTISMPLSTVSASRSRTSQRNKQNGSDHFSQPPTREWSFMGFEWEVNKVHKLRDCVEADPTGAIEYEEEDIQLLKQSPVIGDNKFKLEIAFTPTTAGSHEDPIVLQSLSLYITCLAVDSAHPDYELQATMMTAITCQADRSGERGAPIETVWSFWQTDWTFRRDHEVWECPLPSLSSLLENDRVRDTDSFVVCVQIHCPVAPAFPQQPSAFSIPRDLLEGLEASLDNSNTGDVRFICLERRVEDLETSSHQQGSEAHTGAEPDLSRSLSQSTASSNSFSMHATVRKRVIYAHSDILTRRSEYFATMLASSFSENPILVPGERKIYTIVVEDADFETVYWLLKYCYVNWLLFREDDDPRIAMDSIGTGWNSKWAKLPGGEWDWKTLQRDDGDARSVASGDAESAASREGQQPESAQADPTETQASESNPSASKPPATTPQSSARRAVTSPAQTFLPVASSSKAASRAKGPTVPIGSTTFLPSTRSGYPLSPRTGRQPTTSDPHLHPTSAPMPASALAMYRIAHRYAIPGLVNLALEHMMTTLTPQSSFALLLATSVWDELHTLVEDYVVTKWDEVSITEEFEQCCQEVAAGDWGSEGGKTLTSIFRRLRSPVRNTTR